MRSSKHKIIIFFCRNKNLFLPGVRERDYFEVNFGFRWQRPEVKRGSGVSGPFRLMDFDFEQIASESPYT